MPRSVACGIMWSGMSRSHGDMIDNDDAYILALAGQRS